MQIVFLNKLTTDKLVSESEPCKVKPKSKERGLAQGVTTGAVVPPPLQSSQILDTNQSGAQLLWSCSISLGMVKSRFFFSLSVYLWYIFQAKQICLTKYDISGYHFKMFVLSSNIVSVDGVCERLQCLKSWVLMPTQKYDRYIWFEQKPWTTVTGAKWKSITIFAAEWTVLLTILTRYQTNRSQNRLKEMLSTQSYELNPDQLTLFPVRYAGQQKTHFSGDGFLSSLATDRSTHPPPPPFLTLSPPP